MSMPFERRYREVSARRRGFTLVETVIAIVILGIGVSTVLSLILTNIRHSADPMVIEQANAIAQSYLEEVMLKPFCDPNDFSGHCPADCGSAACAGCSGSTSGDGGPETRASFDDVCDYQGLADNAGALDNRGAPVPGLEAYNVAVTVDDGTSLNGLSGAAGQVLGVSVVVTHDDMSAVDVTLQGYRSNF